MPSVTITLDQAIKAGQRNYGPAFGESWRDALEGDWLRNGEPVTDTVIAYFFGFWFGHDAVAVDSGGDLEAPMTVTFGFATDDEAVWYRLRWLS